MMLKAKAVPDIETASGIPIELPITPTASGAISRAGVEIEQELKRPATSDIVVGVRLFHKMDNGFYEVTNRNGEVFTIRRLSDGTEHGATLRQLKSFTYVYTERSIQGVV